MYQFSCRPLSVSSFTKAVAQLPPPMTPNTGSSFISTAVSPPIFSYIVFFMPENLQTLFRKYTKFSDTRTLCGTGKLWHAFRYILLYHDRHNTGHNQEREDCVRVRRTGDQHPAVRTRRRHAQGHRSDSARNVRAQGEVHPVHGIPGDQRVLQHHTRPPRTRGIGALLRRPRVFLRGRLDGHDRRHQGCHGESADGASGPAADSSRAQHGLDGSPLIRKTLRRHDLGPDRLRQSQPQQRSRHRKTGDQALCRAGRGEMPPEDHPDPRLRFVQPPLPARRLTQCLGLLRPRDSTQLRRRPSVQLPVHGPRLPQPLHHHAGRLQHLRMEAPQPLHARTLHLRRG